MKKLIPISNRPFSAGGKAFFMPTDRCLIDFIYADYGIFQCANKANHHNDQTEDKIA